MSKQSEQFEMKSKIDSWCHQCGNKIRKGDLISWFPKGRRAVHVSCPSQRTKGVRNSSTAFGKARHVTGR